MDAIIQNSRRARELTESKAKVILVRAPAGFAYTCECNSDMKVIPAGALDYVSSIRLSG